MTGADPRAVADLAARIRATPSRARRKLIAIAGPPASGKSTLAADLVAALGPKAALVPMDGFHLDNSILDARGLRLRKGAPETFDAAGFVHLIRRLSTEPEVIVPVFDRPRDMAIAGAQPVGPDIDTAIVEGNYLLLNEQPWTGLHPLWDMSVFLDVAEPTLCDRLMRRWLNLGQTAAQAETRARANDLPNALTVIKNSAPADITL